MPSGKGSSASRGYGPAHRRLRARWRPLVDAGGVDCARCGLPIEPGTDWDLGHVDGSGKQLYSGPEHRSCNRATSGPSKRTRRPDPDPDHGPIDVGGPVVSITQWPGTDWSDHRWRNQPCVIRTADCAGTADRLERVHGELTLICWPCIHALNAV